MPKKHFFNLPIDIQKAILLKAEQQLNISTTILEKDLWVCWLLKETFALPNKMAFKGGTSLSKIFNLIDRFSEDCDITIDSQSFIEQVDIMHISKSQLKKTGNQLNKKLQNYVKNNIIPHLEEKLQALINNKNLLKQFQLKLSDDAEKIYFYYPSLINLENHYLRDHVLLEFGARNSTEPSKCYEIKPILDDFKDYAMALPKAMINTLSPIRTFWEKATLIHVNCHRKKLLKSPDRLSRHWHDLSILSQSWIGEEALKRTEIFEDVIQHKKAFFNASYAHYDDCLIGKIRLVPNKNELKSLNEDFKKMIDAGMFQKKPQSFENIIENLKMLENNVNKLMLGLSIQTCP